MMLLAVYNNWLSRNVIGWGYPRSDWLVFINLIHLFVRFSLFLSSSSCLYTVHSCKIVDSCRGFFKQLCAALVEKTTGQHEVDKVH